MATKDIITEDDDLDTGTGKRLAEELVVVETRPVERDADDDNDDEDARPNTAAAAESEGDTDSEREAIRERRRLEKLDRKERRDKAISRDKLELDFLRKRNDDLERRLTGVEQRTQQTDLNTLDTQLRASINEVEMAEKVISKAIAAGNGDDVTQAMRYRDQAMARANQLNQLKHQASQPAPQRAPEVDNMTMHYAQEFMKENPWYDVQGRDEDSAIVLAVDQALVKDGFNPQTEEYWAELRKRAGRRMPDKFKTPAAARESGDKREPRGGPAVGSGREHAPSSTRREVYISPERKQALMDAGVWDDPVLRMKYVKRYAEYDRTNRA